MVARSNAPVHAARNQSFGARLKADIIRNRYAYSMLIPVLAYYLIFHYGPMGGLIIAFKDFNPGVGILRSPWTDSAGFYHFIDFFTGVYAWRSIRNTVVINVYNLALGFPAPIVLALLLDELRSVRYRRVVQTVSYLPHFISLIVVCGLVKEFALREGVFNQLIGFLKPGHEPSNLLGDATWFRTLYIGSGIWQELGWGSIIYLSALSGVDPELYEAVRIDGGNRWHRVWHVSLPGIQATIVLLFIMRVGNMMNVGYEKIILLYTPSTYPTADVISSYVYRRGLLDFNYSYAAAVGLFNSAINFVLVNVANRVSNMLTQTGLF